MLNLRLLLLALPAVSALHAQDSAQYSVPGRYNDPVQEKKPYVIMISADGFRYDLADKYQAANLIRLRDEGVQAEYMQSSYPSLTFPNHYSLVTGMYPAHHGLVDNRYYDPSRAAYYFMRDKKAVGDSSWYGGTPLWALAESEHMLKRQLLLGRLRKAAVAVTDLPIIIIITKPSPHG